MPLNSANVELFDAFPRSVGVTTPEHPSMELRQYLVHSREEYEGVLNMVSGHRNLYVSLSKFEPVITDDGFEGCKVVTDKASFDFDSPAKAGRNDDRRWGHPLIPDTANDVEVWKMMNEDDEVREAVLGEVCEDVRRLAEAASRESIPAIGVFSGFGIHVHLLYQPTARRPEDRMGSTCRFFADKLNLATVDTQCVGDSQRIMRVPNAQRIGQESTRNPVSMLFTIPLSRRELRSIDSEELMALSAEPRSGIDSGGDERPEMKIYSDYLGEEYDEGMGQEQMASLPDDSNAEEFAKMMVKEVTRMPCVYERAIGTNPRHEIRVKTGIMFLNAGYSPTETTNIIEQLNWVDYQREKTLYFLKNLQQNGKGDWSCSTMQGKGLCARADEPEDCEAYGYIGGNTP